MTLAALPARSLPLAIARYISTLVAAVPCALARKPSSPVYSADAARSVNIDAEIGPARRRTRAPQWSCYRF